MFRNTSQPRFGEPWTPEQKAATFGPAGYTQLQNMTKAVEVIIGKDDTQTSWLLHQKLFENSSEVARTHLQGSSDQADQKVLRLPNENPIIFGEYVKYLYAGCIAHSNLNELVRMYALGSRLHAAEFKDTCYASATLHEHQKCSTEAIKHIFDHTVKGDKFRKFITKQVGRGVLAGKYSWKAESDKKLLGPIMGELMEGVTDALADQRSIFSATAASPAPLGQACPPPTKSESFGGFGSGLAHSLNRPVAPSAGTAEPEFLPIKEKEGSTTIKFQSISVMPAYDRYSAEELRLADYGSGRRYGQGEVTNQQDTFGCNNHGMVSFYTLSGNHRTTPGGYGSNTGSDYLSSLSTGSGSELQGCFGSNNTGRSLFGSSNRSDGNTNGGIFGPGAPLDSHDQNPPPPQATFGGFGAPIASTATTQGASLFAQPNPPRSGGLFGSSGTSQSASLFAHPVTSQSGGGLFGAQLTPAQAPSRPNPFGPSENRNENSGGFFGRSVSSTTSPHLSLPQGHGISCPFGSLSLGRQASKCNCGYVGTSEEVPTAGHNENEKVTTTAEQVVTSQPLQHSKSAKAEAAPMQSTSNTKDEQHSPAPVSITARATEIAKAQEASGAPRTNPLLNRATLNPSTSRLSFADVDVDEYDSFTVVPPPAPEEDDL